MKHTVLFGVAPTPLAAWWLAKSKYQQPVLNKKWLPDRLARIPVECCFPDEAVELRSLGVSVFSQCHRLPKDGLSHRLGRSIVKSIERALGVLADPREPYILPLTFERRVSFSYEIKEVDLLLPSVERLLLGLEGFLIARCAAVSDFEIHLSHQASPATRMTIELVSPTRKSAHLLLLVRERLSRVELIEPVNYLALRANNIVPLAPTNSDLYQNDDAHDQGCDWKTLIERLRARLGEEAVRAVSLYPDHRPEKAFRATIGFGGDTECLLFGRRPVWLLESPAALKATDGIPSFTDQLHLLQGPERIQSGWWDSGKIARDYYVAETPSGERFWIYRDLFNDGRWFLHGLFS